MKKKKRGTWKSGGGKKKGHTSSPERANQVKKWRGVSIGKRGYIIIQRIPE